jgi:hypothetical protein
MVLVVYIFVLPYTLVVTYMYFSVLYGVQPEDGPRWPKHVVNVIIRKVYLVAIEAKYLCFISTHLTPNLVFFCVIIVFV